MANEPMLMENFISLKMIFVEITFRKLMCMLCLSFTKFVSHKISSIFYGKEGNLEYRIRLSCKSLLFENETQFLKGLLKKKYWRDNVKGRVWPAPFLRENRCTNFPLKWMPTSSVVHFTSAAR